LTPIPSALMPPPSATTMPSTATEPAAEVA
jgi:hypothetical protein